MQNRADRLNLAACFLADAAETRTRLEELRDALRRALAGDAVAGKRQGLKARLGDGLAAELADAVGPLLYFS